MAGCRPANREQVRVTERQSAQPAIGSRQSSNAGGARAGPFSGRLHSGKRSHVLKTVRSSAVLDHLSGLGAIAGLDLKPGASSKHPGHSLPGAPFVAVDAHRAMDTHLARPIAPPCSKTMSGGEQDMVPRASPFRKGCQMVSAETIVRGPTKGITRSCRLEGCVPARRLPQDRLPRIGRFCGAAGESLLRKLFELLADRIHKVAVPGDEGSPPWKNFRLYLKVLRIRGVATPPAMTCTRYC